MGFILDGLETEDYDRSYSDRDLLRRIVGYFRPYTRQVLLAAAMIAFNSLAGTGGPVIISRSIDLLARDPSVPNLLLLAAGVLLLGVAAWGFNFVHQYVGARVIGNVVLKRARTCSTPPLRHDLSFYDEHPPARSSAA